MKRTAGKCGMGYGFLDRGKTALLWGLLCWAATAMAPLAGTAAGAEEPEVVDRIVAVVNEDIITLSELEMVYRPFAERIRSMGYPPDKEKEMLEKVRGDLLEQLINSKLTDQEIQRAGISVDDTDVDQAMERIKQANLYTDDQLREALAEQGLTVEDYRKKIKEQILRTQLVNRRIKSKIVITKEDVRRYYDEHREEYQGDKQYHLRTIILKFPPDADPAEKAAIRDKMERIRSRIAAGLPFEEAARAHSEALAEEGGEIGTFRIEDLAPKLQPVIGEMEEGEVSQVLETDLGYQIFHVEEILADTGKPLAEVSGEIEEKLFQEVVNDKFQAWLKELKEQSHIKVIQ